MSEQDVAFHDSFKPSFSADGTLVYAAPGSEPEASGVLVPSLGPIVAMHRDVRFARFASTKDAGANVLELQQDATTITAVTAGMPSAKLQEDVLFATFANDVNSRMSADPSIVERQESAVWRLASILFDPPAVTCQDYILELPAHLANEYLPRMKLEKFSNFWTILVTSSVDTGLLRVRTAEDRAVLLLTKNDTAGACDVLVGAKDYRLATLIAQLPNSSDASRKVMRTQIEAWQRRKDWSEMSNGVRALYSILAGDFCEVAGQTGAAGAAEDRAAKFCISEKFGLSWHQSFSLYVFYGGHATLEDAVQAYCNVLEDGRETTAPTTLWAAGGGEKLAVQFEESEDTLMQLLTLAAFPASDDLQLLEPLLVSGSSLHSRQAWQLAMLLKSRNLIQLPPIKLDALTLSFATELETAGDLLRSAWVLLHLSTESSRKAAVSGLLARNAESLPEPSDEPFETFTQTLQLPASMIFAAKALHAKSVLNDSVRQVSYLICAGLTDEAHDVLCDVVGPQAVIERDYTVLQNLLGSFTGKPNGWAQGGQVYRDFVRLRAMPMAQKHGREGSSLLRALRKGLLVMVEERVVVTLEQRVAVVEMRRYADAIAKEIGAVKDKRWHGIAAAANGSNDATVELFERYRQATGAVV